MTQNDLEDYEWEAEGTVQSIDLESDELYIYDGLYPTCFSVSMDPKLRELKEGDRVYIRIRGPVEELIELKVLQKGAAQ